MFKKNKNQGFTLIELMVVISIIALLSSIVLASIKDARDKSIATKFRSEMQQFISSLELYRANTKTYPYEGGSGVTFFSATVNNNNTETTNPAVSSLSTLMAPYLKTLPRVPSNSYTAANPAWIYYANHPTTATTKYGCNGDAILPTYVILYSDQNPFINNVFSYLPTAYSQAVAGGATTSQPTFRCFSLK